MILSVRKGEDKNRLTAFPKSLLVAAGSPGSFLRSAAFFDFQPCRIVLSAVVLIEMVSEKSPASTLVTLLPAWAAASG
jgi:hypothetical protein